MLNASANILLPTSIIGSLPRSPHRVALRLRNKFCLAIAGRPRESTPPISNSVWMGDQGWREINRRISGRMAMF
jgi:hypothetical protein